MQSTIWNCINSNNFLPYSKKDKGTGRCRIHSKLFSQLGVKVGWVCHFQLQTIEGSCKYEVLCTVWPDMQNQLQDDMICLDDTVYRGNKREWIEAKCTVRTQLILFRNKMNIVILSTNIAYSCAFSSILLIYVF
jgi:hypothetical protein